MTSSSLNTLYILVGQAGFYTNSRSQGGWPAGYYKTNYNTYQTFGGGGSAQWSMYSGWGGGASAIALGPPGLSLDGQTFWTNTQLKMLAIAG